MHYTTLHDLHAITILNVSLHDSAITCLLHNFTSVSVDFMQLQSLHASSVGPYLFEKSTETLVKLCNKHVIALSCNETFKIVIASKSCNVV